MDTGIDIGLLVVRAIIGFIMAFHGTQKLFGWWGGDGLEGATAFFTRLGYRPPRLMAIVAAIVETVGGVLFLLGLFTPVAAVLLFAALVNILLVHVRNGLDRKKKGFEYELVLLAGVACIAFAGAGAFSLDSMLGVDLGSLVLTVTGLDVRAVWAPLILLAGATGGIVVASTRARKN